MTPNGHSSNDKSRLALSGCPAQRKTEENLQQYAAEFHQAHRLLRKAQVVLTDRVDKNAINLLSADLQGNRNYSSPTCAQVRIKNPSVIPAM